MGEENIADLILSTTKLGFSDIIDQLIDNLKPNNTIEEGLICEWIEGSYNYSEKDIVKLSDMDLSIRQTIVNLLKDDSSNSVAKKIFNNNTIEPFASIYASIKTIYGSINQSNVRKVVDIFYRAINKKTEHNEVYNVLNDCKFSGSSAISYSSGGSFKVEDGLMNEFDESRKLEIEENKIEYQETIEDIYNLCVAMCRYVKSNGNLNKNDKSMLTSRAMLITGKGGSGKSNAIKRALEDENMTKNRDYYEISSSSTAVKSLYKKLYDYNGKLLIFDDSGELFDTEYKRSLWKQALQTKQVDANVALPQNIGTSNKIVNNNTYSPNSVKTRQERYFFEVGQSSPEEKEKFHKERFKKLEKSYREETGDTTRLTKSKENEFNELIDIEWIKHEEEKEPLMPDVFNYKGVVVIISNVERETFKKTVGADNWGALMRRMVSFDLHPMSESMWAVIKEIILKQRDMSIHDLPDEACFIPRDIVDEFIEEVENNLNNPETRDMNFSIVSDNMHDVLGGEPGRLTWKRTLKRLMKTNK